MALESTAPFVGRGRRIPGLNEVLGFWPVAIVILSFIASLQQLIYGTITMCAGLAIHAFINRRSLFKVRYHSISIVDVFIASLVVVELIAFTQSSLLFNSRPYLLLLFHALITYYFIKSTFFKPKLQRGLLWALSLICLYWSVMTVKRIVWMSERISEHGFTDLSLFKNAYSPMVSSNEWTLFLLLLLPVPVALFLISKNLFARLTSFSIFTLTGYCLILEFSRGGYIALLVFMACVFMGVLFYQRELLVKLAVGLFVATLIIGVSTKSHWPTVSTTLEMNETVSQQRSADARLRMWDVGMSALKAHPLFGVGAYNFPLSSNIIHERTTDEAPLIRVSSVMTQLVAEKGVVGLLLPISVVLLIIITGWQTLHCRVSGSDFGCIVVIAFLAALASILIREMTLSVLLFRGFMFGYFCILFALLLMMSTSHLKKWRLRLSGMSLMVLPSLILGVLVVWHVASGEQVAHENRLIRKALDAASYDYAAENAQQVLGTLKNHPVPYLHLATAHAQCKKPDEIINWDNILVCSGDTKMALVHLEKARQIEPRDESIDYGLGWLLATRGEWTSALGHLENAFQIDPTIIVYPLSIGIVYEKMGDIRRASDFYAKAIALDPDIVLSRFYQDLIERNPDLKGQIFELSISSLTEKFDPISSGRLGAIHFFEGNYSAASKLLESANADLPGLNRPYYYLGAIALSSGDTINALTLWDKSNFLDTNDQLVNWQYGMLAFSMELQEAERLLLRATRSNIAESFFGKRRSFYPNMPLYANTTLSKGFMEYIRPEVGISEIEEALIQIELNN